MATWCFRLQAIALGSCRGGRWGLFILCLATPTRAQTHSQASELVVPSIFLDMGEPPTKLSETDPSRLILYTAIPSSRFSLLDNSATLQRDLGDQLVVLELFRRIVDALRTLGREAREARRRGFAVRRRQPEQQVMVHKPSNRIRRTSKRLVVGKAGGSSSGARATSRFKYNAGHVTWRPRRPGKR